MFISNLQTLRGLLLTPQDTGTKSVQMVTWIQLCRSGSQEYSTSIRTIVLPGFLQHFHSVVLKWSGDILGMEISHKVTMMFIPFREHCCRGQMKVNELIWHLLHNVSLFLTRTTANGSCWKMMWNDGHKRYIECYSTVVNGVVVVVVWWW